MDATFRSKAEAVFRNVWCHFVGLTEGLHSLQGLIQIHNTCYFHDDNGDSEANAYRYAIETLKRLGTTVKSIDESGDMVNIISSCGDMSNDGIQYASVDSNTESIENCYEPEHMAYEENENTYQRLSNVNNHSDFVPSSSFTHSMNFSSESYTTQENNCEEGCLMLDNHNSNLPTNYDITSSNNASGAPFMYRPAEEECWEQCDSHMEEQDSDDHMFMNTIPADNTSTIHLQGHFSDSEYFVKEEHGVIGSEASASEVGKEIRYRQSNSSTNNCHGDNEMPNEVNSSHLEEHSNMGSKNDMVSSDSNALSTVYQVQALQNAQLNSNITNNHDANIPATPANSYKRKIQTATKRVHWGTYQYHRVDSPIERRFSLGSVNVEPRMPSTRKRKPWSCSCCEKEKDTTNDTFDNF